VNGVAAANVWAAGDTSSPAGAQTLALHWNGTAWTRTPSPNPGGTRNDLLDGVAATSASNAWAVGAWSNGVGDESFVLHRNGSAWTRVPSPHPGTGSDLIGVAASPASDVWSLGTYGGTRKHTLAVHCR
jgi:hypothetical protein